jgi:hypothetical protein
MRPFLCLLAAVLVTSSSTIRAMELSSGDRRVSLIELFTSEGCSSCPPAESWLAQLVDHPRLWQDFVPIAFHVDYWNRLGWRDVFSNAANTARQYQYAAAWQASSVYTPCFVRDGAEWKSPRTLAATHGNSGVLNVIYEAGRMSATFMGPGSDAKSDFEVHGALLASGIVSKVKAGENRGATLRHEFVAVALASGALGETLPVEIPDLVKDRRLALAVWITRKGSSAVLQATGGWLVP